MAVVETLLALLLLYFVNADEDALDVEVRQLLDAIELALEATGRPLRPLPGDIARGDLARGAANLC